MAGRLGNTLRMVGLSALVSLGAAGILGGCGRENAVPGISQTKTEQTNQIQTSSEDKFSNSEYRLEISYGWDTGMQLTLYGEPLDKGNPEKLASQLKSLEEQVQEYEKFKQELIKSNGTNIDFPVFTINSLTNKSAVSQKNADGEWNVISRTPDYSIKKNNPEFDYMCWKIPYVYCYDKNSELIKILNESEKKAVLVYTYFKEDSCYELFNPIINKLFSEKSGNTATFRVEYNSELNKLFNLNPTKSKLLLLEKGFRLIIYGGGSLELKYNGGKEITEKQALERIEEGIKLREYYR